MSFYPDNFAAPKAAGSTEEEAGYKHPCPILNPPAGLLSYLDRLHAASTKQEGAIDKAEVDRVGFDELMKDKCIALDQDKSWLVYQTCLAIGAKNVVEAGTSFGVSTIYLALAVQHTLKSRGGNASGTVIGTEKEPEKAAKARSIWAEAGHGIPEVIDLRVGDLRETLKENMPEVDLLLLDIWAPLALPALKLCEPHFRTGAVVLCDNSISSAHRYAELQAYMRDPRNGYTNLTLPYHNGIEMSVYMGKAAGAG